MIDNCFARHSVTYHLIIRNNTVLTMADQKGLIKKWHIYMNGLAPLAFISIFILACQGSLYSYANAEQFVSKGSLPVLSDSSLKVEQISKGIQFPTDMAFVNTNDILI